MISKLLVKQPEKRLGAIDIDEVKQHPFFSGVNFDTLFKTESPMDAKHKVLSLQKKQELPYLPHQGISPAKRQTMKKQTHAV